MIDWFRVKGGARLSLSELERALAGIDVREAEQAVLREQTTRLELAIRQLLTDPPNGDHTVPWLRTGALRDSIVSEVTESRAVVGSGDPVAVYQEMGTRTIPPRPFLAPSAQAAGPLIAERIAATIVKQIEKALQ